jgi:general secretion pathway protein D
MKVRKGLTMELFMQNRKISFFPILILAGMVLMIPSTLSAQAQSPASEQAPALNLDHVDLHQVINIIGHDILKLNYIVDPSVRGTATINISGQFKKEDLFPLFQTILQINGCTMVKTGELYQIVPSGRAPKLPVSVHLQGEGKQAPINETMVMQVIPMRYVSAADMSKVLTPYLSEAGNMLVHEKGNILILTENRDNLRKLLDLVDIFDADVFQKQRVRLYEIKNHRAASLVTDLESIFSAYSLSSKDSAVHFIPIEKINALLAVSPNPSSFGEVKNWIDRLDQYSQNLAIRTYVYKVENSKAGHIAELLDRIFVKKVESSSQLLPPANSAMPGLAAGPLADPSKVGGEKPLAGFIQGDIRVVADDVYNMLIIQASPQDYETIKETLRELDVVPRQVLIEAKIFEVNLTGAFAMGVEWFLQQRSTTAQFQGKNAAYTAGGNTFNGIKYAAGLSLSGVGWIGRSQELIAFVNANESQSRTKMISAPTVLAADNAMARIQVGQEVPMLASTGVVGGGTGTGGALYSNTVNNRSTGIILSVTPRINSSGWVTLKIDQEVSAPGAPVTGGVQSPTIDIKSVSTQATVKDGETIVIGGIIAETNGRTENRIPGIGHIPLVGWMFGSTSTNSSRKELIILITPHVVQSLDEATTITEQFKGKLQELKRELKQKDQFGDN